MTLLAFLLAHQRGRKVSACTQSSRPAASSSRSRKGDVVAVEKLDAAGRRDRHVRRRCSSPMATKSTVGRGRWPRADGDRRGRRALQGREGRSSSSSRSARATSALKGHRQELTKVRVTDVSWLREPACEEAAKPKAEAPAAAVEVEAARKPPQRSRRTRPPSRRPSCSEAAKAAAKLRLRSRPAAAETKPKRTGPRSRDRQERGVGAERLLEERGS